MAKKTATVKATRNGESREFDAEVWKQLPENKYGWKAAADEPEEVKNLQNTGTAAETGTDTGKAGSKEAGTGGGTEETPKLNAADLAAKIYAAETVDAVNALVPDGEERKTVLAARDAQIALLTAKDK